MKVLIHNKKSLVKVLLALLLSTSPLFIVHAQQKISFGIHADPSVNWFSSDISQMKNNGPGPDLISD